MEKLYKTFRALVRKHSWVEEGEAILVGNSGGADSMVLTHLLLQLREDLPFQLHVAHVNYGLRGEESKAGERLVRSFSRQADLSCYVTNADLGLSSGENFQRGAREFRYHFFSEVALQIGSTKVVMAHHREDQVETILAQLLRGSSLKGLRGMPVMRVLRKGISEKSIFLLRPLLTISQEELKSYATRVGVPFVEDSSNASEKYWRNQLRHRLLPILQGLRPKAFEKISNFGMEMGALAEYLKQEAKQWLGHYAKKDEKVFWLPRPRLSQLPKFLRFEILHQAAMLSKGSGQNLKRDHVVRCEQICFSEKPEGVYSLPNGIQFVRKGEDLFFRDPLPS